MRTAFALGVPVTEELERGPTSRCSMRCIPLLDQGRGHRRGGAAARHLRAAPPRPAAAVEGRHHPRDPPPGEEQPADDLVAAAAAGPAARRRPRPRRPSRSRCAASARSPWCTRSCRGRRATTCRSSTSCGRSCAWSRRSLISPEHPVRFEVEGDAGIAAGQRGHAAGGRAQRAAAERRRPRLPARARPDRGARAGAGGARPERPGAAARASSTTASGCPRASTSSTSTGLGLSIVRTLVTSELAGEISDARTAPATATARARRSSCACRSRRTTRTTSPRRGRDRVESVTSVAPDEGLASVPASAVRVTGAGGDRRRVAPASGGRVAQAEAALRWRASHWRRSLRRSSSEVPPQTPESWLVVRANSRHVASGPRTPGTRPWRSRSARWRDRWCRPGRTDRGRCRDRR